jgi:hypothetical protein
VSAHTISTSTSAEKAASEVAAEITTHHSPFTTHQTQRSGVRASRRGYYSPLTKRLVLSLLALAGLGAQGPRQAPKFTGKSIPDPPGQKEPWTPAPTKLPRFLVSATKALFEQGMADPRGCEYREVEIVDWPTFKARAFVIPERPGDPGRFAVTWDGVIVPVASVGPAAELDADIRALAESMRRARANAGAASEGRRLREVGFSGSSRHGGMFVAAGQFNALDQSALKLCILLRLGRADLAETLFAAGTTWTPEIKGRDLTDYQISYLTLARDWGTTMFVRLVDAHMRADDVIALDAARRLSVFAKAAEAKAMALGFEREQNQFGNDRPAYFPFLRHLPELLADQERRANEKARGPVPPPGADPASRVAGLIRELEGIAMLQMVQFGNSANSSPLVQALVAEGDAAVEPLLAAIETDTRLTRTVTYGRGNSIDRRVHPVLEPELAALTAIFKTQQFSGQEYQVESGTLSRKDLARSMREFWLKNRALSVTERWYRVLRDDLSGYARWQEAAAGIVQPADQTGPAVPGVFVGGPDSSRARMKGEELRARRGPSVSELLARRVLQIASAPRQRTIPNIELQQACAMALLLERWDPHAALPVIRVLMTQACESVDRDRSDGYGQVATLVQYIARFALIRARAAEPAALTEYAAEIRKCDPEKDQPHGLDGFEPLWSYPAHTAIRDAARWLFNDPGSPWAALLRKPGNSRMQFIVNGSLYASPLLRSAGFRDAVLSALAIKSDVGTARRSQQTTVEYELKDGVRGGFSASEPDLEGVALGVEQSIRACDYVAWQISEIEGAPRCELYWTKELRDGAVEACVAFLKIYGDRFTANGAPGERPVPFEKRAHLAFPKLDHPATKEDVRAGRAIFSLEGEAEVRVVKVPSLPLKAKWIQPEEMGGGALDGWVWQAEEVRRDGEWKRYLGFVGGHVIVRIPAGSIDLADGRVPAPADR